MPGSGCSLPCVGIEIREAAFDEHDEAGRVTALAYAEFVPPGDEDWEEYLGRLADVAERAERTVILVAVEEGRILGCVTLELSGRVERHDERDLDPDEAHVRMLGVHPEARRRGIARMLMEACLQRARREGKTRMTLHTTQQMVAAQRMYEAMDFRRTPDHVFPDGFVLLGYERGI